MRLIDADALKEKFDEYGEKAKFTQGACQQLIDNAPTVTLDMEFAKWVTKMIFDNNTIKDFDFELFSELACRKLEKLGLVEKTESEWIKKGGAE